MKIIVASLILGFVVSSSLAQPRLKPKNLKVKGPYNHPYTSKVFPETLGEYIRVSIKSFDKKNKNIGVTYEKIVPPNRTSFSLFLYPAGNGTEDRLRSEYLASMQSIANLSEGVGATQYPIRYELDGFKVNGFQAEMKIDRDVSKLGIYECGSWFFKYRVTSNHLDSLGTAKLIEFITDSYPPTDLVRIEPLNPKADIHFAPAAFADSTMLYCTMAEAFKKLSWANENIDSLERISGFPSIYLEMHVEAISELVDAWKRCEFSRTDDTFEYLSKFEKISEAGFIEEFLLDQHMMIFVIPDNVKIDMDRYRGWAIENSIDIDLSRKLYVISYNQ